MDRAPGRRSEYTRSAARHTVWPARAPKVGLADGVHGVNLVYTQIGNDNKFTGPAGLE